ncbi:Putrescine transport system permease protein PotH [Pelagimonas phthalicica]|uniref:Putrescine transport system permease protein PotH n=1 Tax=Pelagimonas phthalicica TaxID=1037362 RepID=A0A238JGA0_9RHOB|nr:iron ABC transporter permease [Pelagimonas phthalicica]TDS92164.1 iron(III) transport system permease protein [Pelagimonas phthalicica]SMX29224.1 Putrescine transport system permease protein PotH [Pelagimonas phthalicica]
MALTEGNITGIRSGRLRRLGGALMSPERVIAIIMAIGLAFLVLVPLLELLRETLTVQPYDKAYLPNATEGDLTTFHYERVFSGRMSAALFYKPFIHSLITATGATVFCLVLGASLAWVVVRTNVPFREAVNTMIVVPYMLPSWVMALAWLTFFKNDRLGGSSGVFVYLFGVQPPDWLAFGALPIIICLAFHYYVYAYLILSGALSTVDSQLEEAGAIAGLSRLRQFLSITAPLVLPALGSAIVMTFIRVVGSFGTPAVLGMPVRYFTLPTQIYAAIGSRNVGDGYLLALVLVLMAILFIWINQRMIGVRKSFVTMSGKGVRTKTIDLGPARWLVLGLVVLLLAFTVILPIGLLLLESLSKTAGNYDLSNLTLHYWIGERGDVDAIHPGVLHNPLILGAAWNSIRLAFSVAILTGVLGFLLGYVVVRTRGTFASKSLEMSAFLPYIFPSVAFGAIYIGMFSRPIGPFPALYGTFFLLVLISSVKNLPYTSRTGIAALLQIDKSLEEAARTQGIGWFARVRRIIIPLASSGLVSGMLLSFIGTMRELSLIILLVTPSTAVLASVIYTYQTDDVPQLIGAATLLLVLLVITFNILFRLCFKNAKLGFA